MEDISSLANSRLRRCWPGLIRESLLAVSLQSSPSTRQSIADGNFLIGGQRPIEEELDSPAHHRVDADNRQQHAPDFICRVHVEVSSLSMMSTCSILA
jgi:hypothetical protein